MIPTTNTMTRCLILALLVGSSGFDLYRLILPVLHFKSANNPFIFLSMEVLIGVPASVNIPIHQLKPPGYCARSSSSFSVLFALLLMLFLMGLGG